MLSINRSPEPRMFGWGFLLIVITLHILTVSASTSSGSENPLPHDEPLHSGSLTPGEKQCKHNCDKVFGSKEFEKKDDCLICAHANRMRQDFCKPWCGGCGQEYHLEGALFDKKTNTCTCPKKK
eukprot:Nk52_evm28s230 gene=Nk52_evmTU28s230